MKNSQAGFSLIELILVVTILGILAAVSIPLLMKARETAQSSSAYSALRSLSTLQVRHYTTNSRFARLDELIVDQKGLGDYADNKLTRGSYTFVMEPLTPSDEELTEKYKIVATSPAASRPEPYILLLDQTGVITPDPFSE